MDTLTGKRRDPRVLKTQETDGEASLVSHWFSSPAPLPMRFPAPLVCWMLLGQSTAPSSPATLSGILLLMETNSLGCLPFSASKCGLSDEDLGSTDVSSSIFFHLAMENLKHL